MVVGATENAIDGVTSGAVGLVGGVGVGLPVVGEAAVPLPAAVPEEEPDDP
jgi:hypothetical protein